MKNVSDFNNAADTKLKMDVDVNDAILASVTTLDIKKQNCE